MSEIHFSLVPHLCHGILIIIFDNGIRELNPFERFKRSQVLTHKTRTGNFSFKAVKLSSQNGLYHVLWQVIDCWFSYTHKCIYVYIHIHIYMYTHMYLSNLCGSRQMRTRGADVWHTHTHTHTHTYAHVISLTHTHSYRTVSTGSTGVGKEGGDNVD